MGLADSVICNTLIVGFSWVQGQASMQAWLVVTITTLKTLTLTNSLCARSQQIWSKFITTAVFCRIGCLPGDYLQSISSQALQSAGMVQHAECIGTEVHMVQMIHVINHASRWNTPLPSWCLKPPHNIVTSHFTTLKDTHIWSGCPCRGTSMVKVKPAKAGMKWCSWDWRAICTWSAFASCSSVMVLLSSQTAMSMSSWLTSLMAWLNSG